MVSNIAFTLPNSMLSLPESRFFQNTLLYHKFRRNQEYFAGNGTSVIKIRIYAQWFLCNLLIDAIISWIILNEEMFL
jgi:hypothetical protein